MHHYVYKLESETGAFYFGVRSSSVSPLEDSYMGSGTWPKLCRKGLVKLQKSIVSTHSSRQEACLAEAQIINQHLGNELLMNRYFGVQNHLLGPREETGKDKFVRLDASLLNSAFWVTESPETKAVWITFLCLADMHGFVNSSLPGLAHASGVPIETCLHAIERMKIKNEYDSESVVAVTHIEATNEGWCFPAKQSQTESHT